VVDVFAASEDLPGLAELAQQQAGVLHREQLAALGVDHRVVTRHVRASRWTTWGRRVVALQNVPLTGGQLWWAAVLHAGPGSALASLTALESGGLTGFEDRVATHIVVPRGIKVPTRPGLVVHESRRLSREDLHPGRTLPQLRPPRACIDAASWTRNPRRAIAVLAATVQQRLCRADQLQAALATAGPIRHARLMRTHLHDIVGGAEALSEIDLVGLCRTFGLEPPAQQEVRRGSDGRRRYLDCLWELPDGSTLVLEVDGAHHLSVGQWSRDMRRERSLVLRVGKVLRCSAYEARCEQAALAADLAAAGVPRLVSNSVA